MTADHDLLIRIDERTAKIEETMATKDYVNQVRNELVIEHHGKKSVGPIDKKLIATIIAFLTVATLYIQSLF